MNRSRGPKAPQGGTAWKRRFIFPSNASSKASAPAVKGEIGGCDLVALGADETPIVVIGEIEA